MTLTRASVLAEYRRLSLPQRIQVLRLITSSVSGAAMLGPITADARAVDQRVIDWLDEAELSLANKLERLHQAIGEALRSAAIATRDAVFGSWITWALIAAGAYALTRRSGR